MKTREPTEEKKNRNKASSKSFKADSVIHQRLKDLRRKYKIKFGVAFDATRTQQRDKGWLADYIVLDLTVALPSKEGNIPDDFYRGVIEIFRRAEMILNRDRTLFLDRKS